MHLKNLFSVLARGLAVAAVVFSFVANAPVASAKSQETCPVSGGKIDKAAFVDHEGQRVYFCCPGCIAKFQADPAKYLAAFKAEGVVLETSPAGASGPSTTTGTCGCGKDKASCGCDKDKKACGCDKGKKACGCDKGKGCACDCGK
jgi:YHS domain-containing protein